MTITTRKRVSILGLVGMYVCLCAGGSRGQASDKPKAAASEPQTNAATKIDLSSLVYPYYEWVAKDAALAWVARSDGSVVGIPLTGEHREEKRISDADDVKKMGSARPFGFKMSPDGNKILYLMGGLGGPAGGWCVGRLEGKSYICGDIITWDQAPDLVWKRNSTEWVSLEWLSIVDGIVSGSVTHYYTDGVTPPDRISINRSPLTPKPEKQEAAHILGVRQDGIAIVPVRDGLQLVKVK